MRTNLIRRMKAAFRNAHRLENIQWAIEDGYPYEKVIPKLSARKKRRVKMWLKISDRLCHKLTIGELESAFGLQFPNS